MATLFDGVNYNTQIQIQQPQPAKVSTGRNTAVQVMALGFTGVIDLSNATAPSLTSQVQAALILPTADPHVVGALWNNSNTVTVSAG